MTEFPTGKAEETEAADEKVASAPPPPIPRQRACPECREMVSVLVSVCPHCGQSLKLGNGMAVASFVFGILSLLTFASFYVIGVYMVMTGRDAEAAGIFTFQFLLCSLIFCVIPAMILSRVSLSKIRKSPFPVKGRILAKAGLNMGSISMVLTFIVMVAIPSAVGSRRQANESAAISNIRTIAYAQEAYRKAHGIYARSFVELTAEAGSTERLVDDWRRDVQKKGYVFSLTDDSGNGSCYETKANPVTLGKTGNRYFFSDCSRMIRWSVQGPADLTSTPIGE